MLLLVLLPFHVQNTGHIFLLLVCIVDLGPTKKEKKRDTFLLPARAQKWRRICFSFDILFSNFSPENGAKTLNEKLLFLSCLCSTVVSYFDDHSVLMNGMFYLTMHSTHFIYGYVASDIIVKDLSDSDRGRQDSSYHGLCYRSWSTGWNEK